MHLEKEVPSLTWSLWNTLCPVCVGWVQPADCMMFVQEKKKALKRKENIFQFSSSCFNVLALFTFFMCQTELGQQRTAKGLILNLESSSHWQLTSAEQPWSFVLLTSSASSRLQCWWKGLGTLRTSAQSRFAFQSECRWKTKPVDWCTKPTPGPLPRHHNWHDVTQISFVLTRLSNRWE